MADDFKLAGNTPDDIKIGAGQVDAIYMGVTKVWPPVTASQFSMSNGTTGGMGTACPSAVVGTYWRTEVGPMVLGEFIYTDANLTTTLTGNNQYYKVLSGEVIQISATGEVIGLTGLCP